jgi:hypothetical protein
MQKYADEHQISLYTVYKQISNLVQAAKLCDLHTREQMIHAIRNSDRGKLISEILLSPLPPEPERYIAACENSFQSGFFTALKQMLLESDTGPAYIQQILDVPRRDAISLYKELRH